MDFTERSQEESVIIWEGKLEQSNPCSSGPVSKHPYRIQFIPGIQILNTMYPKFLAIVLLLLSAGCSSNSQKSKFETAENSSPEVETKKKPDWMTSQETNTNRAQKSANANPGTDDPLKPKQPTGDASTTGNFPKPGQEPVVPAKNTPVNPGSTALMARLLKGYQDSQKFFQEQQSVDGTKEQVLDVREQYADMVAAWLTIADQLVKQELRPQDRQTVVQLKQLGHQILIAFDRSEHEQKLYDFGETLKDDPNNEIKKIYEFTKLQKPFTSLLRGETFDKKEFFQRLEKVIKFWRDDPAVYQNVQQWIKQLYESGKREEFIKALELAAKHFPQSTNTQIMSWSEILDDRLMVANIGFDLAITDVIFGKEGGFDRLFDSAKRLLAKPNQSGYVLNQVVQAGIQLELKGKFKLANDYYRLVGQAIESYSNQKLKEQIQQVVKNAEIRYGLLGKPLKVEGVVPKIENGEFIRKPIDFSAYRGKVVILFFWAFDNKASYVLLRDLDRFYLANQDKDITLIGVNADREMSVISEIMSYEIRQMKRKWTHLMPSTPKVLGLETPMAKRCGVDFLPFNIVIDQQGKVDSFRVYGDQLETVVSRLLGEPVNKVSGNPKEPAKKEPAKKEPAKKEPAKKEPAKKEPAKKEPAKK